MKYPPTTTASEATEAIENLLICCGCKLMIFLLHLKRAKKDFCLQFLSCQLFLQKYLKSLEALKIPEMSKSGENVEEQKRKRQNITTY